MKPQQGKPYTTTNGDTVQSISIAAFGVAGNSSDIIKINQTQVPLTETGPIATGTVLLIPADQNLRALRQAQLKRGLVGA